MPDTLLRDLNVNDTEGTRWAVIQRWLAAIADVESSDVSSIIGTAGQIIASNPTGSVTLSLAPDITGVNSMGGTTNMTLGPLTGNASRSLTLKSTTAGGVATAFLTGNADQSVTFFGGASYNTISTTVIAGVNIPVVGRGFHIFDTTTTPVPQSYVMVGAPTGGYAAFLIYQTDAPANRHMWQFGMFASDGFLHLDVVNDAGDGGTLQSYWSDHATFGTSYRLKTTNTGASAYSLSYWGTSASDQDATVGVLGTGNVSNYGGARSMIIGTNPATPVVFMTSGAEKMRLSAAGNFLVGTTSEVGLTGAGNVKTAGAALVGGNITFGTSGSILNGTTGAISLTATGTNQSINITPSGTGSINLMEGLDLEFTGNFISPVFVSVMAAPSIVIDPLTAVAGRATWLPTTGVTASSITINGGVPGDGPITLIFHGLVVVAATVIGNGTSITSIDFPDLTTVVSSFGPGNSSSITSITAPNLKYAAAFAPNILSGLTTLSFPELESGGSANNFAPTTMAALTTWSFPKLRLWGTSFAPSTMGALTNMTCALLRESGGFAPTTMALLTTFSFPAYTTCRGNWAPTTMAALTNITMNAMTTVVGNVSVASMASLTTLSLAGMISYGGTISVPSASCANVNSVTLGTIGTLKLITGPTITLSGLKIPSANVNAILALLVSLDGTGGTTLWGSGQTLTINGGTNGAPTGQGITDKATLAGRGATVTTN